MSLLRKVLKSNKDAAESGTGPSAGGIKSPLGSFKAPDLRFKKSKSSAASFVSRATTIQSIQSFYTAVLGGSKTAKRRRPDILKFGAPTFYNSNPPPSEPVPGVERIDASEFGDFGVVHAFSLPSPSPGGADAAAETVQYLSILLASHARKIDKGPVYLNHDSPSGEVRIRIDESETRVIQSIKLSVSCIELYLWSNSVANTLSLPSSWVACRATLRPKETPSLRTWPKSGLPRKATLRALPRSPERARRLSRRPGPQAYTSS